MAPYSDERGVSSALPALVTFIANQPGCAEELLARHVDDGDGRCLCCVYDTRRAQPHPCVIRRAAAEAVHLVNVVTSIVRDAIPCGDTEAPRSRS